MPPADVSIPNHIITQVYQHYQANEWCLITLNKHNQITHINSKAKRDLGLDDTATDIQQVLPVMATETLNESFYLPFYHHDNQVFDIHFKVEPDAKYLIFIPVDILHKQVQYKQQLAHDEELEKMRFKTLFETLESAHTELQLANEAKSFYISALSHEMGNPLNVIKGYNNLLQDDAMDVQTATAIIDKNVDKLTAIIQQALDYNNHKSHHNLKTFKPKKLVDELFNDFELQAQQKSLSLNNCIDEQIKISSNLTKWQQILTNLISNAIKYTEQGGVTVYSTHTGQRLNIDVSDSGCGISHTFQKQLFQAWSREYRSEAQGNGIGLVISKMLTEQIGGTLTLHHSGESGSTFRLSVPQTSLAKSILLVDDDEDCLQLFKHFLTEQHHQVTTASDLNQLKYLLEHQVFDAIITDLNLAQQQVTQAFDLIAKKVALKIVVTANPSPQTIAELLHLGFDQVLVKPLNQQDLVNSVA